MEEPLLRNNDNEFEHVIMFRNFNWDEIRQGNYRSCIGKIRCAIFWSLIACFDFGLKIYVLIFEYGKPWISERYVIEKYYFLILYILYFCLVFHWFISTFQAWINP